MMCFVKIHTVYNCFDLFLQFQLPIMVYWTYRYIKATRAYLHQVSYLRNGHTQLLVQLQWWLLPSFLKACAEASRQGMPTLSVPRLGLDLFEVVDGKRILATLWTIIDNTCHLLHWTVITQRNAFSIWLLPSQCTFICPVPLLLSSVAWVFSAALFLPAIFAGARLISYLYEFVTAYIFIDGLCCRKTN